jgi:hypothetical protein
MLYLVPVVILSFMHITCTNTLFPICQVSLDDSFFCICKQQQCSVLHQFPMFRILLCCIKCPVSVVMFIILFCICRQQQCSVLHQFLMFRIPLCCITCPAYIVMFTFLFCICREQQCSVLH